MSVSNFFNDKIEMDEVDTESEHEEMECKKYNETYSLKIITEWLTKHNISYKYSSSLVGGFSNAEHGVKIDIKHGQLSIQTHPMVASWAFAETLETTDYDSDKRHETPEMLFEYISGLL
jgi:hypothetical protein